jgi:23S rRNA (guanosine2251-2'-O)-methyltransferase
MTDNVLVVHDIRSAHNVGSILRSAACFGIAHVYLGGYTPYPLAANDERLPHIANKVHKTIVKTSLGAEQTQAWSHYTDISQLLTDLRERGFRIAALELTEGAVPIDQAQLDTPTALLVGREVEGISTELLNQCDIIYKICQTTAKESLNVSVATAIACYQLSLGKL